MSNEKKLYGYYEPPEGQSNFKHFIRWLPPGSPMIDGGWPEINLSDLLTPPEVSPSDHKPTSEEPPSQELC